MTLARRLAVIETSLTPTQLVLRWLGEAHQFGSFEAHATSILDTPLEDLPLNRLCREAEESARRSAPSRSRDDVGRTVRKALRETVFRFFLVLRANVTTHEVLEKETYIQAAMACFVAMLLAPKKPSSDYASQLSRVCSVLRYRVVELESRAAARLRAAERYLDGREMLFPALASAWQEQLTQMREHMAMALQIAELDGVCLTEPDYDDPELRIEESLADLVEPAKAMALEKLGAGAQGLRIARAWLRPKLSQEAADPPSDLALQATL